jgi:hypothetical protein
LSQGVTNVFLKCGPALISFSAESLHGFRGNVSPFSLSQSSGTALEVCLVDDLANGIPFNGNLGPGKFALEERRLLVVSPQSAFRAEAILRLAWAIMTERLGGVLLHASAVSHAGRAVVVSGKSGTGKSTIARHAREAGAQLLSDEMVQWLPDAKHSQGLVWGTPFFSDADLAGGWHWAVPRLVCTVEHAQHESLRPWPPAEAVKVLMAQRFQAPHQSAAQATAAVMQLLKGVSLGVFSCRNAPAAGEALLAQVSTLP